MPRLRLSPTASTTRWRTSRGMPRQLSTTLTSLSCLFTTTSMYSGREYCPLTKELIDKALAASSTSSRVNTASASSKPLSTNSMRMREVDV